MLTLYALVGAGFGAAISQYRPVLGALLGAAISTAAWLAGYFHVI